MEAYGRILVLLLCTTCILRLCGLYNVAFVSAVGNCKELNTPQSGAIACYHYIGLICSPFCNDQFDFSQPLVTDMWACGASGGWLPSSYLPDCTKIYHPSDVKMAMNLHYYCGDCSTPEAQAQIKNNFIKSLNDSIFSEICLDSSCNPENVTVMCGSGQSSPNASSIAKCQTLTLGTSVEPFSTTPSEGSPSLTTFLRPSSATSSVRSHELALTMSAVLPLSSQIPNPQQFTSQLLISSKFISTPEISINPTTAKPATNSFENTGEPTPDPPTSPTSLMPSVSVIGTTEVFVHLSGIRVLSNGKTVSFYQMIVISLREGQSPGKLSDEKHVTITRNYDNKAKGEPYITAEFANDMSRTTFTIGDGKYYSRAGVTEADRKRRDAYIKYLNGKLDEGTGYAVFERAFAEDGDYQNLEFITFTTKKTNTPFIIAISIAVGLFALLMVIGGIVIWRRFRQNGRNSSSKNPQHCSTQEIIEMSPSLNLPTTELAYSNPCTDPGYNNTDHVRNKPGTAGQVTYEEIGEAGSDQATDYDDVQSTPESIYQEIDEETRARYQSLNINRPVTYGRYVKPVKHH